MRKIPLVFVIIFVAVVIVYQYLFLNAENTLIIDNYRITELEQVNDVINNTELINLRHHLTIQKYYDKRKDWVTSNLGAILFKNEPPRTNSKKDSMFLVLMWKYWDWLKSRHLHNFDNKRENPLDDCSVTNCIFTGDLEAMGSADAVIVHMQHGDFPTNVSGRNPSQRWVFLSDESPKNVFSMAQVKPNLRTWANVFNWSMTYRSDADIPVPYGRTAPLENSLLATITTESLAELVPYWKYKRRDVLVTILMSNCAVKQRMDYLKNLQMHVTVDVFGKCSENHKKSCPGHFKADCETIQDYLFYLVFENSQCRQYLTEKGFHNAYAKGAIPIILGPPLEDCVRLLPPNSFLHIDQYKSPKELAADILSISKDDESLLLYHEWRNDFEIVNEHGYLGSKSYHLCRICEALNYNSDLVRSYQFKDLELFFNPKLLCK